MFVILVVLHLEKMMLKGIKTSALKRIIKKVLRTANV